MGPIGVLLTLCALSFLLNGTFLIVICKSWKLVKGKRITYHVANLAIADGIAGASGFCKFMTIVEAEKMTTLISAFDTIAWMAVLTSFLAVCLMAIERALCIKKPHTWKQILPLKNILLIIAGSWVLAISMSILFHYYPLEMKFVFLVIFFIPITVTSVVYINIYMKFRTSNEECDEAEDTSAATIEERRNKMMQRKVGTFVLILVLILIISVSPTYITLFVQVSCELFQLNCTFMETVQKVQVYFYILAIMNHVVNPIFYAWRISLYRQAFWQAFGRATDSEVPETYVSTINVISYSVSLP